MSQPFKLSPTGDDVFARLKCAKKTMKVKIDKKKKFVACPFADNVPPMQEVGVQKKISCSDDTLEGDPMILSFYSNASAHSNPSQLLDKVDEILLPENKTRMDKVEDY